MMDDECGIWTADERVYVGLLVGLNSRALEAIIGLPTILIERTVP